MFNFLFSESIFKYAFQDIVKGHTDASWKNTFKTYKTQTLLLHLSKSWVDDPFTEVTVPIYSDTERQYSTSLMVSVA